MSTIGLDSCFYDRLDSFSRSLNHVLLAAKGRPSLATEVDWQQTLQLVQTLAAQSLGSLAASAVAASLLARAENATASWEPVAEALLNKNIDALTQKTLYQLAWALDEERAAVLARMRQTHA